MTNDHLFSANEVEAFAARLREFDSEEYTVESFGRKFVITTYDETSDSRVCVSRKFIEKIGA